MFIPLSIFFRSAQDLRTNCRARGSGSQCDLDSMRNIADSTPLKVEASEPDSDCELPVYSCYEALPGIHIGFGGPLSLYKDASFCFSPDNPSNPSRSGKPNGQTRPNGPVFFFAVSLQGEGNIGIAGSRDELHYTKNTLYIGRYNDITGVVRAAGSGKHCQVGIMVDQGALRNNFGEDVEAEVLESLSMSQSSPRSSQLNACNGGQYEPCVGSCTVATPDVLSCAREIVRKRFFHNALWEPLYLRAACINLLFLIIINIKDAHSAAGLSLSRLDIKKIHQTKSIIDNDFKTHHSIKDLCKIVGLNEFKLKTGFKEIFNTTLFKYSQSCKMLYAQEVLACGEKNVSQCAWEIGYTNVSHFISAFKKYFGVTPGDILNVNAPHTANGEELTPEVISPQHQQRP